MENIEILKLKDRHRIIKEHNFNTMEEVEAYRKAIDDYRSKQLTLTDVSQQRELLMAFDDWCYNNERELSSEQDIYIDKFLNSF